MQSKERPFLHLVQLSAPFLDQRGNHVTQIRLSFVHQSSMMLLHALVDFIKQIEMLLWGYKQKNRSGSANFQFPPFSRIGIRFYVLIGKQKRRTSIAVVRDVFQKKYSVAEPITPFIVTVKNYVCIC